MELYDSGSTADLDRLADSCVDLLRKHKLIVTTAESCTGGMLSAKLVDIPGCFRKWFQEGLCHLFEQVEAAPSECHVSPP